MPGTPTVAEIFETMSYGPAPETDAPAQAWLEGHDRAFGMYIGGCWTDHDASRSFETLNPATTRPLARLTRASTDDVDAAVAAARAAFGTWSRTPGHVRARHLYALTRQIQKHSRLLAVLETLDNGKPIRESRDIDVPLVARHFSYHAGWAQLTETALEGYEPVGVIGQIVPWNFPLLMLAWKIAPALAMGNTVVLKPAEWTPLSALAFAELCDAAALPPGVVNIVTGDATVGQQLVRHPGIGKIAFTGSTEVGRFIRAETAGTGKRLSLELGGKSPFVVFDDADLDSAVEGVVDAIWFNQGQVCCAGSRLLVQEGVASQFHEKLRARMEHLRVGDPLDKCVDIGPIIAPVQLEQITRLVAVGAAEGATVWQPSAACPTGGWFHPPTILSGVSPSSTVAQDEIFGPVLVTMTFRTPSEAVALANNTRYGLAASVWSEDINLALDVAGGIKAGVVWINSTNVFDAASGFGGYRESGFGREGGREGLYEYLRASEPGPALVDHSKVRAQQKSRAVAADADAIASFDALPPIDRTPKLYIGGKQARPDSGYSRPIMSHDGRRIGEVGAGNRKDIRNAVEAARAASGWADQTAHNRAQVLFYVAENLSVRADELAVVLDAMTGLGIEAGLVEVQASIDRLFTFAAWADKWDGAVHRTPFRAVTLAFNEPIGVVGIVCPDEAPLLAPVTLIAAACAMGNAVVVVPSCAHPMAATELYQVLDTSDVPGGVVNLVTGDADDLAKVLAQHDDVDALWHLGAGDAMSSTERLSAGNLKRTWTNGGRPFPWHRLTLHIQEELLRESTQVKNVWVPFGA